jgi:two-component system sensor kinase FixL
VAALDWAEDMRAAIAAITRNNNPQNRLFGAIACVAAVLLIAIGVAAMAAWHINSEWLWTSFSGLRMKYNSSLAFIASGVGLFAAATDRKRLTMVAGTIGLTIGGAICLQYLVDGDFGVDELLMKDYLWPNAVHPGRMTFRGALDFFCFAMVLILTAGKEEQKLARVIAVETLTFIVLAIAVRAITGNLNFPGISYALRGPGLGSTVGIAGLAALGIGLVALIWPHRSSRIASVPLWLPMLLCFAGLIFDFSTPSALTAGIVYIPIIFCGLWFRQPSAVFIFAAITTAATVWGHFVSPSGDIETWIAIANRGLTIGVLWSVATLVFLNRRSDGAFKQSKSRLEAVVDHALDGVIAINEKGIVEHFNPACERIFGYEAGEVVGRNIKMLMPEPFHGEHDGYLSRYLKTGEAHIIGTSGREVTARRKDGSEFPMDLSITPFHLEDGRHFSGIVRDATERKKVERQIIEEATRTQAVMNTVLDGVITIDGRGTVQTFNPAAVRIFGYQPEEVIGRNINMLMPEPYQGEHDGYLQDYLTTGIAKVIGIGREVSGKRKDGTAFPMELGVNEMQVGNTRMFVGTVRDISERKRAEEVKWQLAAVVESSIDAIITSKPDGNIVSWNVAAERLFGYRSQEVIGLHIGFLVPQERRAEEVYIMDEVKSGRRVEHLETVRLAKDGRSINISMTVSPIRDSEGRLIGATGISRDISERKATEVTLQRYNTDLERSNQELDDFAYIASHDLKEPLRGLFNHAQFLLEDYGPKLDAEGLRRLYRLGQLCQRMEQLINDLMYFSRLGRAEMAVQETDLNAVILDIQKTMDVFIDERRAQIVRPRSLPITLCDPVRTAEVFRNLITNAIKYCDKPKPRVEIGFLGSADAGDAVDLNVFYVKDNGVGIDPAFHQEIFRIFKRLQPSSGKETGSGVGLTFVKKIVERQGGRVWLDSEVGTGTTFYFTLNNQRGDAGTIDPAKEPHERQTVPAHSVG